MSQVIIFETESGGVAIVHPAPDCGLTMEELIGRTVPVGASSRVIDSSALPGDRSNRDSWTYAGIVAALP